MKSYFYLVSLFILSSCGVSTQYISIDVREPAVVTFPEDVKRILIVDNTALIPKVEDDDSHLANSFDIVSNDSAKNIMLNSLVTFMNEEGYFEDVQLYSKRTNNGDSPLEITNLTSSKVRSLIRQNKVDALISVDLFGVSAGIESESVYYFNDYSFLRAHVGVILKAYGRNGSLLATPVAYIDSLFLEGSADWSIRKSKMSEINGLVSEISVKAADNLTSAFIPSWSNQPRWYFTGSSSEMKKATALVLENNWAEAADVWSLLYDKETDRDKKIKLASNLALANECLDDIENASAWATVAFDLLPDRSKSELAMLTAQYKRILSDRVLKKSKLYKQLGLDILEEEKLAN